MMLRPVAFVSAFVLLTATVGCGSSGASAAARKSAAQTAGKVKTGMTTKEVETAMGGPGSPDANDPNTFHFPTEDGDVKVTFADGKVSSVGTQGDR